MSRSPIPPSDGSYLPTAHAPFGRAVEKLMEAQQGLLQMKAARDRVAYEAGWTRFIDSVSEFWTRLRKEGELRDSRFLGWLSAYEGERRSDELLSYITKARNQSQHGLVALKWTSGGGLTLGGRFAGTVSSVKVFSDGTYEATASPAPKSPTIHPVSFDYGQPHLPEILDKHTPPPISIPPPTIHRGHDISGLTPADAATLAFSYYEECLRAMLAKCLAASSRPKSRAEDARS